MWMEVFRCFYRIFSTFHSFISFLGSNCLYLTVYHSSAYYFFDFLYLIIETLGRTSYLYCVLAKGLILVTEELNVWVASCKLG